LIAEMGWDRDMRRPHNGSVVSFHNNFPNILPNPPPPPPPRLLIIA